MILEKIPLFIAKVFLDVYEKVPIFAKLAKFNQALDFVPI